jgi:hypothetical protein
MDSYSDCRHVFLSWGDWATKKLRMPASDSLKGSGECIGDRSGGRAQVAIGAHFPSTCLRFPRDP